MMHRMIRSFNAFLGRDLRLERRSEASCRLRSAAPFEEALPAARLRQTYGLSEVGILRSNSPSSTSLWMRIGGEGFETRVVDGMLEIKARSAMLGRIERDHRAIRTRRCSSLRD